MKLVRYHTNPSPAAKAQSLSHRRCGIPALIATAVLCFGASFASGQEIPAPPSAGQAIGILAVFGGLIGGATYIAVSHSHHTLKGCVFAGSNGLKLQTSDWKLYAIEGDSASITPGTKLKLHGSRVKKEKDHSGDQVFRVEKVTRDYGPCHAVLYANQAE